MKKLLVASAVIAGIGVLMTVGFLIASGVDYRQQEDSGVEPGYTPAGLVLGLEVGLWFFGIGIAALIATGIMVIVRRRRGRSVPFEASR